VRALHQWITDNGQTPHLVVDAAQSGVAVPEQHVQDGRIILNVSYSATSRLELANDEISFDARFGGVPRTVRVPLHAVLGIYAKETGEGLVFPTDEYGAASGDGPKPEPPPDAPASPPSGRPNLKIVR
jgi:stringent starvation protein B